MVDTIIPTAADIMTRRLVTLRPEISVLRAMRTLLEKRVSGAPVLDDDALRSPAVVEDHTLAVAAVALVLGARHLAQRLALEEIGRAHV